MSLDETQKGSPPQLKTSGYDEQKCCFHRRDVWIYVNIVSVPPLCIWFIPEISSPEVKAAYFCAWISLVVWEQGCMSGSTQEFRRKDNFPSLSPHPPILFHRPVWKGMGYSKEMYKKVYSCTHAYHICTTCGLCVVHTGWVCTPCFGM